MKGSNDCNAINVKRYLMMIVFAVSAFRNITFWWELVPFNHIILSHRTTQPISWSQRVYLCFLKKYKSSSTFSLSVPASFWTRPGLSARGKPIQANGISFRRRLLSTDCNFICVSSYKNKTFGKKFGAFEPGGELMLHISFFFWNW